MFFTLPFAILYLLTSLFYIESESPDLLRLGYIPNIYPNYYTNFNFPDKEKFEKLSQTKKTKFKILTIGDSFSEQGTYGYKNYLAEDFSVLHVDRFLGENQVQTLVSLLNGDFFEKISTEYVILQILERNVYNNVSNLNLNHVLTLKQIDSIIQHQSANYKPLKNKFFSRKTVEFPLYHLPRYFLEHNYLAKKNVFNVDLVRNDLFSTGNDKLLFYHYDFEIAKLNNIKENVVKANNLYNEIAKKLANKGVKLIVIHPADKYDFYYDYIQNKEGFDKPLFFNHLAELPKSYIHVDGKELFSLQIEGLKDIYFYDDTHWSPVATKILASKLKTLIR